MTKSYLLSMLWLGTLLSMLSFNAMALADTNTDTNQAQRPFTMTWSLQPSSLEPNGEDFLIANHALASHVFDPLFNLDSSGSPSPILVKSFQLESSTKWLFTLKSGVKFHDGSELSSADVIATFARINAKEKQNPYREILADLRFEAVNPMQFRITTAIPDPDLPSRLILFFIIKETARNATQEQFSSGEMMIGTGPYQFVSHQNLQRFTFKAFAGYHREPAYIQDLNVLVELEKSQRIQDYITGKTDFIDDLTPTEAQTVINRRTANIINVTDDLLYMLYLDVYNDQPPNIRDHHGYPLQRNPLKDRNVRLAISLAVNRNKLIENIFGDIQGGVATGQFIPPWNPAFNNRTPTPLQDIPQAKQLLAKAGYPDGFQLDIYDKETRLTWVNALAGMLAQVGIAVTVKTLPPKTLFQRASKYEFSVSASLQKESSIRSALNNTVFSKSVTNRSRYINPKVDELILIANQEFNNTRRMRQYRYIAELALADQPIVPLFFTNHLWLTHPDVVFSPAGERLMEAYYIRAAHRE